MRGEEVSLLAVQAQHLELPPHARRRDSGSQIDGRSVGITSACAEKRYIAAFTYCHYGNYLRMRGEEIHHTGGAKGYSELPPHARRRAPAAPKHNALKGITSACAEKSR